jgi:hypothetical protein
MWWALDLPFPPLTAKDHGQAHSREAQSQVFIRPSCRLTLRP